MLNELNFKSRDNETLFVEANSDQELYTAISHTACQKSENVQPKQAIGLSNIPQSLVNENGQREIKENIRSKIADRVIRKLFLSDKKDKVLFDQNPLPMFIFSKRNMAFMAVNKAAVIKYGYTLEEFLNMTIKDIRPKEDIEKLILELNFHIKDTDNRGIWRHKKKNGDIISVEVHSTEFNYDSERVRLSVLSDISRQLDLENLLETNLNEKRTMASGFQTIREEDRKQIALEVHDQLGQILTGLRIDISRIKSTMDNNPVQIKQMLNNAIQTTDEAIAAVREIASSLRPPLLDDMGLAASIEWHANKFSKTSGIPCTFTEVGSAECIDENIAIGLFRIFQEALTNTIRHAFAKRVYISLIVETRQITLTIHDNGLGFDIEKVKLKKPLGLTGMKERAFAINGDFTIQSRLGSGTTIKIKIKL